MASSDYQQWTATLYNRNNNTTIPPPPSSTTEVIVETWPQVEVPTAPTLKLGECKVCKHPINEERYMLYACGHFIHHTCTGRLAEIYTGGYMQLNCYSCQFKNRGKRLNYKNDDTINERTLSFKQWVNLLGLKSILQNGQKEMTITKLISTGVNMKMVLDFDIGFSNLMENLSERPQFAEMVEFGMVKEIFKVKGYRHLIPLNRVISYYKLNIDSLSGKYKEIFHFDVNDLPDMGADSNTLGILNLDMHMLAIHGATNETIKRLRISENTWASKFNANYDLLKMFGVHHSEE